MNNDFICRMANESDSVEKIAKYIHLTDPYIYPLICRDPEDRAWQDFIGACLCTPGNVYHLEHIAVLCHGDEMVGAACLVPCGKEMTITDGIPVPEALFPGMEKATQGYFMPLIKETLAFSGYNLVNICVDDAYRGQGLGKKLLRFCIERCGDAKLHLDAIASNTPAIRLYEGFGFQVTAKYMGFTGTDTGLPCYHMVRKTAQ